MTKKTRLQNLIKALTPDSTSVDFKQFDEEVARLKSALTEKIQVQTIDDVQEQLNKFRKKLDFSSLFSAVEDMEVMLNEKIKGVSELMDVEISKFNTLLRGERVGTDEKIGSVTNNITALKGELSRLNEQRDGEMALLRNKLDRLQEFNQKVDETFIRLTEEIEKDRQDDRKLRDDIKEFEEVIEKLRRELTNRINNLPHGGNMNRNISIGGNASALSRYTDINLKAGANVTITYSNNNVTKNVDITISSSGGGGSVGGTVRSINRVSTSQTMGATTGTDYVYIADQGIKLTLPTAASNTNLYTIKNVAASSVLVVTTGGQTIDTDTSLILATQFTAVDLINDGADNWSIT